MISRPLSIAILVCAGLAAASQALALGFGRIPESIPFGQSLDLSVPLRLEAGESLAPSCVQAEVHVGDHRLPPGALQVVLEPRGDDWRVRLRSATVVQEPLVAVNLAVGCNGSVSRQFVVFADPPSTQAELPRVALAEVPPPPPVAVPAEALPRAAASAARPAARKPARKAQAETPRTRTQASALAARSPTPKNPAPRLKLEEPEERLRAATLAVAAQDAALASAAQAASAAEAAASAAEQRMAAMEANLKSMRDDAAANRASMELMRQRLAQSEDQSRMQSLLAAVVAALLLLVLWLGWRVRALQRERQAAWWQGAAAAEGAAAVPAGDAPEVATKPAAAAPAVLLDEPDTLPPIVQPDAVPPPVVLAEESLTRPVSVDELIDLEQQAEFFLVLGEEDAAVDLLMSHLRSTGGTSPLPYLKLLEIYRRRGDHDAYERMRRRFSQRFNAVAPEWAADPEQGRDLQDYPVVLAVLQAAWPRPLDAMTELENLLFRKRSGELFELPAYRDVLALYSVARDLHRHLDQPTHDVDVLLPLGVGEAASPSIFDNLDSSFPDGAAEDRPTAPVDLDLSEPTTASSAAPAR